MRMQYFRRRCAIVKAGTALAMMLALQFLHAGRTAAQEVLSVPELIRDYKTLEGKVVTVRGIYTAEAIDGYMIPEFGAKRYGKSNVVSVTLNRPGLHRLYGRLERSLIKVRGEITYSWLCDERVPYEQKVPETDEFVIVTFSCPMFSGVGIEASSLQIVDTYAASDPRISGWAGEEWGAQTISETNAEYPALLRLARAWRRAILDRDADRLKRLTLDVRRDKPFRPPDRFYNIAFRGKDSLRSQMRRNRTGPIHIVHRVVDYDDSSTNFFVDICLCLRRACGKAEVASLGNVIESSLKDPLWCFDTEYDDDRWYVYLDSRPEAIWDGLTDPDSEDR